MQTTNNQQNASTLEQQAIDAFPMSEYVDPSSVYHARAKWVAARRYLRDNKLEIKPLIGLNNSSKLEGINNV